jgi:general secretion pathway protein G
MTRNMKRGFTLVEILIVVIILGILAAIVIPQFTNASQEARRSSLQSTVQSVRSQIELYKLEHGDQLPDLVTNWTPLTVQSNYNGKNCGPYMQSEPRNGMTNTTTVKDGTAIAAGDTQGFVYDYNGGTGTGRFWGVEKSAAGAVSLLQD